MISYNFILSNYCRPVCVLTQTIFCYNLMIAPYFVVVNIAIIQKRRRKMQKLLFPDHPCERTVSLAREISGATASAVCKKIEKLNSLSVEPILLTIDSKGGDAEAGLKIYGAISVSSAPVIGLVLKEAWSSALIVLQACQRRLAKRAATLKIHNVSRNFDLSVTVGDDLNLVLEKHIRQVTTYLKEVKNLQDQIDILVAARIGSVALVRRYSNEGKILPAQQALKIGLIDDLVD